MSARCPIGYKISSKASKRTCSKGFNPSEVYVNGRMCCVATTTNIADGPKKIDRKSAGDGRKCPHDQRVATTRGRCPKRYEKSGYARQDGRACCELEREHVDAAATRVAVDVKNEMLALVQDSVLPEVQEKLSIIGTVLQRIREDAGRGKKLPEWRREASQMVFNNLKVLGIDQQQLEAWFLEYLDFVMYLQYLSDINTHLDSTSTTLLSQYLSLTTNDFDTAAHNLYRTLEHPFPKRLELQHALDKFIKIRAEMIRLERKFEKHIRDGGTGHGNWLNNTTLSSILFSALYIGLTRYVGLVNSGKDAFHMWDVIVANTDANSTVREFLSVFFRPEFHHSIKVSAIDALIQVRRALNLEPTGATLEDLGYIPAGKVFQATKDLYEGTHLHAVESASWPIQYLGLHTGSIKGLMGALTLFYLGKTYAWPQARKLLEKLDVRQWWDIQKIKKEIQQPVQGFQCSRRNICVPIYSKTPSSSSHHKTLNQCLKTCHHPSAMSGGYTHGGRHLGVLATT